MDPIIVQLNSVTIFWKDLGYSGKTEALGVLGDWWEDEVEPWLAVINIRGDVNPHASGVWFSEPRDAALFLTRFYGTMPNK